MLTRLLAVATLLVLSAIAPAQAAESSPISEAETVLFLTNHLKDVAPPATLRYSFRHGGSMEKGYNDTAEVMVNVGSGADAKQVSARFLSGENALELPPVESAEGNPALLYFLERDIREMKRLTGAKNQNYFKNRIRLALAEAAEVRQTKVTVNGREYPAKEIRISPYLDDPNKQRFERYTGKYYVFTFCEQVPGHLVSAAAFIPDKENPGAGKPALIEDVLSYTGVSASTAARK